MSKELDEAELATEIDDEIQNYGRQAALIEADDTSHTVWITPPRRSEPISGDGNRPMEVMTCLTPAKGVTWDVEATQRLVDGTRTYRVVRVDPIDSGTQIAAYKLFLAR